MQKIDQKRTLSNWESFNRANKSTVENIFIPVGSLLLEISSKYNVVDCTFYKETSDLTHLGLFTMT